MSNYLPIIIGAVLIVAILLWWLLPLGSAKKTMDSAPKDIAPPPAAAVQAAASPKLKDKPAPASKTAKAKTKAPAKTATPKKATSPKSAAPKAAAKPVAVKAKTEKAPKVNVEKAKTEKAEKAPKAKAEKVEAAKAPKAKAEKAKAQAAPKAKAAKPAPTPSIPDNLELIKGLGPKVNTLLKGLGVTSFAQVASWTAADVSDIDAKLGAFAGRITRDNWIDQAKLLAAGNIAGFEKKYGALGSGAKG